MTTRRTKFWWRRFREIAIVKVDLIGLERAYSVDIYLNVVFGTIVLALMMMLYTYSCGIFRLGTSV